MILNVTEDMLGTYRTSASRFNGKGMECDDWILDYIGKMAEKVLQMVTISINSLKSLNPELVKTMTKQRMRLTRLTLTT